LSTPLLLIVGANDRTVPPAQSEQVRAHVPGARLVSLPGFGHLAHEEAAAPTAGLMLDFAREAGALP